MRCVTKTHPNIWHAFQIWFDDVKSTFLNDMNEWMKQLVSSQTFSGTFVMMPDAFNAETLCITTFFQCKILKKANCVLKETIMQVIDQFWLSFKISLLFENYFLLSFFHKDYGKFSFSYSNQNLICSSKMEFNFSRQIFFFSI